MSNPQGSKGARRWRMLSSGGVLAVAIMGLLIPPSSSAQSEVVRELGAAAPAMGKQWIQRKDALNSDSSSDYTSMNWAGYVAENNSTFRAVHARWVQPAVTCTRGHDSWFVAWVGLDGWGNGVVEQGGSSARCANGTTVQYNLWWEMYPHNDIQLGPSISPGDTIDATVTYNDSTNNFDIVVTDVTSGVSLRKSEPCFSDMHGCPRVSAEVVTETPLGGNADDGVFYLPKYGNELYSSVSVTDNDGHTGTFSDSNWSSGRVRQVSQSTGVEKQTTSSLSSGGASFSTTWEHE